LAEVSRPHRGAGEPRGDAGPQERRATTLPGVPGNFKRGSGFTGLMGLEIDEVSPTRVTAHLEVTEKHLQPYGLVHGGVYAAIAETVASIGAMVAAAADGSGRGAVGLENHTSFLRASRAGQRIEAEAVARHAGSRVHQWEVTMRNAQDGRELATSTVRLLLLAPDRV
jgi:uncharacterized protein (TIGR00369 family)